MKKITLELTDKEIESLVNVKTENLSLGFKIALAILSQTGWVARNPEKIDWY